MYSIHPPALRGAHARPWDQRAGEVNALSGLSDCVPGMLSGTTRRRIADKTAESAAFRAFANAPMAWIHARIAGSGAVRCGRAQRSWNGRRPSRALDYRAKQRSGNPHDGARNRRRCGVAPGANRAQPDFPARKAARIESGVSQNGIDPTRRIVPSRLAALRWRLPRGDACRR